MKALEPLVWPLTAALDDEILVIGGVSMTALAEAVGTPAYVLDEADVRERMRAWKAAFGTAADVAYAGKAFLTVAIAKWVAEEGLLLDVCTGGELACALRADFPPERLVFHGNNKSLDELRRAVSVGVGRVVVDSSVEIERLALLAAEAGIRQSVYVRVTPGVEAHTHEFIATGQEDQKFGFSIASGAAHDAVVAVLARPSLELRGLHSHIGSQIFDTAGFALAAHRVVALLASIQAEHGVELPELDLGGGLGIAYTEVDTPLPVEEVALRLREIVRKECADAGLAEPRISVEPGRAIVGRSTVTLYEVGTVKQLPELRTYVSVDGGMSDNIRTALYDAQYTARVANRAGAVEQRVVTVVGKHCESGDVVVRDVALPSDVRAGDLLAVPASGGYHHSMASTYNHVTRPPVVVVKDGQWTVVVRRETEDDLFARDLG